LILKLKEGLISFVDNIKHFVNNVPSPVFFALRLMNLCFLELFKGPLLAKNRPFYIEINKHFTVQGLVNRHELPYLRYTTRMKFKTPRKYINMNKTRKNKGINGPGYKDHSNHLVEASPFSGSIRVSLGGKVIARTDLALKLKEADYAPVFYIPRKDVDFSHLEEISLSTYCPFKGDASYWKSAYDKNGKSIAWGYNDPFKEVVELSDYIAFYNDRVIQNIENC